MTPSPHPDQKAMERARRAVQSLREDVDFSPYRPDEWAALIIAAALEDHARAAVEQERTLVYNRLVGTFVAYHAAAEASDHSDAVADPKGTAACDLLREQLAICALEAVHPLLIDYGYPADDDPRDQAVSQSALRARGQRTTGGGDR